MNYISETEVRRIVQSVIQQTSGLQKTKPSPADAAVPGAVNTAIKVIAIGCDHGGFDVKRMLIPFLSEMGHQLIDCGTNSTKSVDYPDFAYAVADKIRSGEACCGIVIDGAGIGSCMAANKVPGVRAAMCYDYATAKNSREHNDANVLSLGAGLLGVNQIKTIVKTWLEEPFGGGRHAKRVNKIMEIEKRFFKES